MAKFYGEITKLVETQATFARGVSKDSKDKGSRLTICLGNNPESVKEGEVLRIEGDLRRDVLYATKVIRYGNDKKSSGGGYNKKEINFRMSAGNATNVVHKLIPKSKTSTFEDKIFISVAVDVFNTAQTLRDKLLEEFSEQGRDGGDIGAKVGSAMLHVAEVMSNEDKLIFDKIFLELLSDKTEESVRLSIAVENAIKEKLKEKV